MAGVVEVTEAVAGNLRRLRRARGWSLDVLAHRSGVSKGVLVALEQQRGNPSLTTLCRLSDAFAVSITEIIDTGESSALRTAAVDAVPELWHGPAGGSGALLLSSDPPHPVELWRWRLLPGERRDSEAHAAGTRELCHVDAGTLTLELDGSTTGLETGSAATFPGDRPHGYANHGTGPVTFTLLVTVP